MDKTKHKQLVLRKKKRRKSVEVGGVKWIRVIMDESLIFDKHWQMRFDNARGMLDYLNGIGTPSRVLVPPVGRQFTWG